MKIYIDFDGTIFNTEKLYEDTINFLIGNNISEDKIHELEKELFKESYEYDLDLLTSKLVGDNKPILDYNNYIFKDVELFLKKAKEYFELILLTCGAYNYQLHKIESSNIKNYFNKVIVVQKDKDKLDIDYKNSIFIDNNPLELDKFYNKNAKEVIRIRRIEDSRHYNMKCLNNIKEFNLFSDKLLEYLISLKQ